MSVARTHFLGRIEAIQTILANPISTDTMPVPIPSSAAVTVRNGCMVMLFCALEAFIRDRSLECAKLLNQTTVPYTHLPPGLKYLSLVSTFEGLLHSTKYWPENDKTIEFEKAVQAASSGVLGSPYQFTEYSFARDKSNVSGQDLVDISKSFHVDNFWNSCTGVWAQIGVAFPTPPSELFKQLSVERHKAAHVSGHNVPHVKISNFIPQAVAIALAFDTLISAGAHHLSGSSIALGTIPPKVRDTNISFCTVKPHTGGKWAAFNPSKSKALLVKTTEADAFTGAMLKATPAGRSVVCHDASGRPIKWASILG